MPDAGPALVEWQFAFDELTPAERQQAVPMAADWGWYELAVTEATSLRIFNDYTLLYPQPFEPSSPPRHASRSCPWRSCTA